MSKNALTKPKTQLPALTPDDDPYLRTAARVASGSAFLKYVKGTFVFGIDEDELALGTELVPNMEEIRIGWLKWQGSEVIEERVAVGPCRAFGLSG